MSYRTILVPVGEADNAASAIAAAFLIAKRFRGHVHGLHVLPDLTKPATHALIATRMTAEEASSDFRRFSATAEREVRRQAVEVKRLFDEGAARVGAPTLDGAAGGAADRPSASWQSITGFESEIVGRLGRIFDLTVIAQRGPRGASHDTVEAALVETGRPLLLVPPEPPASVGDAVLLAWNASPQAARAVAAALPFLTRAARVVVVAVGNGPEPEPTADQLARSLAWHGVAAEARHVEQGSGRVRDILLAEAKDLRVDLLVIGAYSHSRMRQIVFGGVTEHMLDHADLPILMTR
ncbi:MAG: UspA [Geminicoccaceae bacterium]|nr:UspA [Geminicoccaceae bacterium]